MTCPRCEGQQYDKGSCTLCGNLGFLCPTCGGRMERTPVYSNGRPTYLCTDCRALVVDEAAPPVAAGKLIPLRP